MLKELREQLKDSYPTGCVKQLEDMEEHLFHLSSFTSQDALKLGSSIALKSNRLAIVIHRLKDDTVIFRYLGDEAGERNIGFAMKKRNTVLETGHCSLWALVKSVTEGGFDDLFQEEKECLPVAGAFPVFVNNEPVATIAVSGLHDGMDYTVVVEAMEEYTGKKAPEFSGKLL